MGVSSLLLLLTVGPAIAVFRGSGSAKMQPEVVSKLLSDVEKKWTQSRVMVLRNVTDDATSYSSMEISCLKVSSAVVVGSEGEKDRVVEYMQDVCGAAPAKDAPTATMCTDFASGLERVMTDDEGWNRESLDLKPFCKRFWDNTVAAAAQAAKQRLDEEEAKKEAEEKKRAEEEEKMKEEEAKKAAEEEAARKAAEEEAAKKAAEEQAAKEAAEKEAAKEAADEAARTKAYESEQQKNATAVEAQEAVEPTVAAPQVTVNASTAVEVQANATQLQAAMNATETKNATESKDVSEVPAPQPSNVTEVAVKK